MSRSIGAKELSDQAAELERSGRSGDMDALRANTPAFIEKYRKLGDAIREATADKE